MIRLRLVILGVSLVTLGVCVLVAKDGHLPDARAQAPEPPPTVTGTVAGDGSEPPTGKYQRFPRVINDPDPDYGPHPTVFHVNPATIPTAYPYGVDQVPQNGVVNFTGTTEKSEHPIRFEVDAWVPGKRTFGSAPDQSWFAAPYFTYDKSLSCPETSCTPHLDATLYAKYGSVGGKVTLKDGSSLGKIFFVSARPKEPYPSPAPDGRWRTYTTVTTEEGDYDFAANSLLVTDRNDPCLIDGVKYHCEPIPIATANEWGLPVLGNGGIDDRDKHVYSTAPGEYDYAVAINSTSATGVQQTTVRSSVASPVNFELELEDYLDTLKYQRTNRPFQDDGPEDKLQTCGGNNAVPLGYGGGPAVAPRPVSLLTGNVFLDHEDVRLPGLRNDFVFTRSYNSVMDRDSRFGVGWNDSFDKRLEVLSTTGIRVWGPDGNAMYFTDPDRDGVFRPYGAPNGGSWIARAGTEFVRTFRSGGYEEYKATGQLKKRADRTGRPTTFTYNGTGRLTDIVSPEGRRVGLEYDFSGHVTRLTGPMGVIAEYSYVQLGEYPNTQFRLTGVRYAGGTGYHFTYDDSNRLLSVADLTGLVLENHGYDTQGRAAFSELSDGVERRSYTYEDGRTLVTDARGTVSTFEWTQKRAGRFVTRVTGCDFCGSAGGTRTWEVDDEGRTTRYVDADNNVTLYRWEGTNLTGITNALGHQTVYSNFDQFGRAGSVAIPGRGTTTFTYGPDGLATMTLPTGQTIALTYENQRLKEISSAGLSSRLDINDAGDLVAVIDPRGEMTTFTYDAMGRVTAWTPPDHQTTRVERAAGGAVTAIVRPDGKRAEIHLDSSGRLASSVDEAKRSYGRSYDRYGRLQSMTDPLGSMRFEYDQMSSPTALIDPLHRKSAFEYDSFGLLKKFTDPANAAETYQYYPSGRLRVVTDRRGVSRTFAYDGLSRLTSVSYSDGTPQVAITYDDLGRTVTIANGTDAVTRVFDHVGRLLSESSTFNGSTVSFTYTDRHERATLNLNGSLVASYAYSNGYLDSITADGGTFGFDYDEVGRRRGLTFPNGVVTAYEFDPVLGWLAGLRSSVAGGAAWEVAYTHDVVGSRVSKTVDSMSETYAYDNGGRLVRAERSSATPRAWRWDFDAVGNRTSETVDGLPTSMIHDLRNRLTTAQGGGTVRVEGTTTEPASVNVDGHPARLLPDNRFVADVPAAPGQTTFVVEARDATGNLRTSTYRVDVAANGTTYSYDGNGNLVTKTRAGETWTYDWNGANQLVGVLRAGSEVARFAYDGLGRRIEKVANGVTRRYTYDGADILTETVDDGSTPFAYRYLQGPGFDEPLARKNASTGAVHYYHADALGSIVRMTDSSGAVVLTRNYDAWGNLEGSGAEPGYAFTGREWDPETGLYYYRSRYYDPTVGRFLSEDPIRLAGGINFYRYVEDDPAGRIDPTGLESGNLNILVPGPNGETAGKGTGPDKSWTGTVIAGAMGAAVAIPVIVSLPEIVPILAREAYIAYAMASTAGAAATYGEYLACKAPRQVAPGVTQLEGVFVNDMGRAEPWVAHYDKFGRLIGRTDYNAGNIAAGIPAVHHVIYEYGPGFGAGRIVINHAAGPYVPK